MHWHVRRLDQGRDEGPDWGPSTEYIEVDDEGRANRQVEIYDNGRRLKYDRTHWIDFHGELFDLPLADERIAGNPCSMDEFYAVWDSVTQSHSSSLLARGGGPWPVGM